VATIEGVEIEIDPEAVVVTAVRPTPGSRVMGVGARAAPR